MFFDEVGEGCIRILQIVDGKNKLWEEEAIMYTFLGVFLVFFAFSSREGGG